MINTIHILDTFSRFELEPNTAEIGSEKTFSLYGLLILPTLLGSIVLYNFLGLEGTSFWVALITLFLAFLNVYLFHKRTINQDSVLKLIIDNQYIQMMNHKQLYFQVNLDDVHVESLEYGNKGYPTIKISGEHFNNILIGVKTLSKISKHESNPLCQPDFWLTDKEKWDSLSLRLTSKETKAQ